KEGLHEPAGNSLALFADEQTIQDFMRPERRCDRRVALFEHKRDSLGHRGVFIGEAPSQNNGRIHHEPAHRRPSLIRSLTLSPPNDNLYRLPKLANRSAPWATGFLRD